MEHSDEGRGGEGDLEDGILEDGDGLVLMSEFELVVLEGLLATSDDEATRIDEPDVAQYDRG